MLTMLSVCIVPPLKAFVIFWGKADGVVPIRKKFFYTNGRYRLALGVADDPLQMAIQVAKAGYATDPNYAEKLFKIISTIEQILSNIDV